MPIEFRCENCQTLLRVPDDSVGRQAKCPKCDTVMTVPAATPTTPATPAGPAESLPGAGASPFGSGPASGSPESPFAPPPMSDNPYSSPTAYETGPQLGTAGATALIPTSITISDVMNRAWIIFQQRPGFCVGTWFLMAVISNLFGLIVGFGFVALASLAGDRHSLEAAQQFGNILNQVFSLWLTAGQFYTFLQLARGQQVSVGDIFTGGPYLLRFLGAGILYVLMILFGSLLLIIPGIILGIMFSQCFFLIVDRNMGIGEALSCSREITNGNKGTLFLMGLCILGLCILAVIPCGLGLFVLCPYLLVLYPVIYLAMTGQRTADQVSYYTAATPGFAGP